MNRLRLLSESTDDSQDVVLERKLTVGVSEVSHGCSVAAHVIEKRLFSSVHVFEDTTELWETTIGKPRLTRANPFLDDKELLSLDESGLIRKGSCVRACDVLASVLEVDTIPRKRKEKRPAKGMQWVRDRSWRVPDGWNGATVESAKRFSRRDLGRRAPQGLWERIEIVLRVVRPLEIGDVLLIGDQPLTVSRILDSGLPTDSEGHMADLVVSQEIAEKQGIPSQRFLRMAVAKAENRAAEAVQSRNVGPYSLITQIPLSREPSPGQPITLAQVSWLRRRGLNGLLSEFVSLKSDDLANRGRLAELVNEKSGSRLHDVSPAAPESLLSLWAWLISIGLAVELSSEKDHVCLAIRPATADQLRAYSSGEVLKPETVNYRTLEDTDDGLFGPNVFGPSRESRRRRFGHMELAAPIVPMLWRTGNPSVLSQVLGIANEDVERVIQHERDVVWQDDGFHLESPPQKGAPANPNNLGTGALAIRELASRISVTHLSRSLQDCVGCLTTDVVAVIPPDLRPLVLLDSGNFATHDVNDLYRHVVNRNNRLKKLLELKAPEPIIVSERLQLQEAVDALHGNMLMPEDKVVWRDDQAERLVCALSMVIGAANREGKTVDWSARARLVADKSVAPNRVLVPGGIYKTLRLDDDTPLLLTLPDHDGRFVARLPNSHEQLVVRVSPQTYAELTSDKLPAPVVQVHRPVTTSGWDEAKRLASGERIKQREDCGGENWLDGKTPEEILSRLIAATLSGDPIPLDSPRGLLTAGIGFVEIQQDSFAESTTHENDRFEVPIPVEDESRHARPTLEEMAKVAEGHKRKACLFDVSRADQPPPAERGRMGGQPYLPRDFEWPTLHGKPLPFLGQFPLDMPRDAGLLPIEVRPNWMMTVFGGEGRWEPGPCRVRCPVLIHTIHDLILRAIPDNLGRPGPLCSMTPRIVEELPDWEEMREILNWELERPEPEILREFHEQKWPQLPSANQAIKIGGWPAWVQTADSTQPLLLQIATHDDAEIMFGDSGTLYLFVEDHGELVCFSQCY